MVRVTDVIGDGWLEFFPIGGEGGDNPIPYLRERDGEVAELLRGVMLSLRENSSSDRADRSGEPNPNGQKEHT